MLFIHDSLARNEFGTFTRNQLNYALGPRGR